VFLKGGFVSAPEAREKVAHGETVGFLAKKKSAPDVAAESTIYSTFFRPVRGW